MLEWRCKSDAEGSDFQSKHGGFDGPFGIEIKIQALGTQKGVALDQEDGEAAQRSGARCGEAAQDQREEDGAQGEDGPTQDRPQGAGEEEGSIAQEGGAAEEDRRRSGASSIADAGAEHGAASGRPAAPPCRAAAERSAEAAHAADGLEQPGAVPEQPAIDAEAGGEHLGDAAETAGHELGQLWRLVGLLAPTSFLCRRLRDPACAGAEVGAAP